MHYYDLDSANARLIVVRPLLEALRGDRDRVASEQGELHRLQGVPQDAAIVAERDQREAAVRDAVGRMHTIVAQLVAWDVTLRDISSGLVDFPALADGHPVWLCWRFGEVAIEWWHGTDEGLAGRRPLSELPGPTTGTGRPLP